MKRSFAMALLALALLGGCRRETRAGYASDDRQSIRVVGSPELFTLNARVADRFSANHPELAAPVVESMADRQALALVCGGVGLRFPDVAAITVPPTDGALEACRAHGVQPALIRFAGEPAGVLVINGAHLKRVPGLGIFLQGYGSAASGGPAGS